MRMRITVLSENKVGNTSTVLRQSVPYEHVGNSLLLTRETIAGFVGEVEPNQVWGIDISFDCDDAWLRVVGISHVALRAFADSTPHFSRLLVAEAQSCCSLVGLSIGHLDVECANWQIVDSSVDQINVGIRMARDQANRPNAPLSPPIRSSLAESKVGLLRVFANQEVLRVTRSVISHLTLEPPGLPQVPGIQCAELKFENGATVERLGISGTINTLTVQNSAIEDIRIRGQAMITNLNSVRSIITRAYNCRPESFLNPNLDTWSLVQASARADNNDALYASAGYEGMELWRQRPGWVRKGAYWLLKATCGYGYRPARALTTGLIVLVMSTLLFWGITFLDHNALALPAGKDDPPATRIELLGYSSYLSVITFTTTGYGDVTPRHPAARIVAGAEAISGIVLFSLYIFALTKRYSSLR